MLAAINTNTHIKNDLNYRATQDLQAVVTPQAVALCAVWIKFWVPFENKKREDARKAKEKEAQGEVEDESETSDLTALSNETEKTKKRGRLKGNPSYLEGPKKEWYKKVLAEVTINYKNEYQKGIWNSWWKRKMKKVIEENDKKQPEKSRKRKRTARRKEVFCAGSDIFDQVSEMMAV